MTDRTAGATVLSIGAVTAALATYFLCRARIQQTHNRILVLEREMALARLREEANEKKFAKIYETVVELRETTENQLGRLRKKLDKLIAESFTPGKRSAA